MHDACCSSVYIHLQTLFSEVVDVLLVLSALGLQVCVRLLVLPAQHLDLKNQDVSLSAQVWHLALHTTHLQMGQSQSHDQNSPFELCLTQPEFITTIITVTGLKHWQQFINYILETDWTIRSQDWKCVLLKGSWTEKSKFPWSFDIYTHWSLY